MSITGRANNPGRNYLPRLRRIIHRGGGAEYINDWWNWSATQEPPFRVRARNRRRNQIARASRKANR